MNIQTLYDCLLKPFKLFFINPCSYLSCLRMLRAAVWNRDSDAKILIISVRICSTFPLLLWFCCVLIYNMYFIPVCYFDIYVTLLAIWLCKVQHIEILLVSYDPSQGWKGEWILLFLWGFWMRSLAVSPPSQELAVLTWWGKKTSSRIN